MCGLSFFCVKSDVPGLEGQMHASLAVTKHRGPDASGTYFTTVDDHLVGIGHNRLSILDLSATGSQPMFSGSGVSIVFNGEVFNFRELRDDLIGKGHNFNGSSDTEVILKLYVEYKEHAFKLLEGMFTFVILDEIRKKVFLARDVVGIKPVYYYFSVNGIYGCSEIRGLKSYSEVVADVDHDDVFEFFNNGFLYEPNTGYKAIKKVLPGSYLEYDLTTGECQAKTYQEVMNFKSDQSLFESVKFAVKRQLVADVPVGVFFSGGADSSILASFTGDADLFFAKYEATADSAIDMQFSGDIAKYLGKKLVVTEVSNSDEDVFESIDFVAANTEELVSDYTFWATYQLSAAARKNGYTVMLSGMGGDEAFAGYPRYTVLKHHKIIRLLYPVFRLALKMKLFPKRLDKKFERLVSYAQESYWPLAYSRMLGYFSKQELTGFFPEYSKLEQTYIEKLGSLILKYKGDLGDKVKCAQYLDQSGFLSHNLSVSDKASMLASIELRVPLLDERVLANGFSAKSAELLEGGETKAPLKHLLKKLLPASLVDRPKTGFNPPLDGLIRRVGLERLSSEFERIYQYVEREEVAKLVKNHFSGGANNTYKLWQLLYFERWLKLNFV
jgi:asparagine synthase (glutamine-hydrolysing)